MILVAALITLHAPVWIQDIAAILELALLGVLTKTSFSIKRKAGRLEVRFLINQASAEKTPAPYPPESPTDPAAKLPVSLPPSEVK